MDITQKMLDEQMTVARDGDLRQQLSLAQGGEPFFEDVAQVLSKSNVVLIRYALAKNVMCPYSVLEDLTRDDEHDVIVIACKNPNLQPAAQMEMALSESWEIRAAVAANRNIAPEVIETLRVDPSPEVQGALQDNPTATRDSSSRFGEESPWV